MSDETIGKIGQAPVGRSNLYVRLDDIVRRNRFTIAVVFPLVGAAILIASAEGWLPGPIAFNPVLVIIGVFVMRTPLISGILPALDRRALGGLGILAAYTYAIENVGVHTGVPYGEFAYGVVLGPMIDGVPVALPILFIPLAVNAYLVWLSLLRDVERRVALAAAIPTLVLMDVVLDPAAVALGFWHFTSEGAFYGVPLSNYLGWILSACIAVLLISLAFDTGALRKQLAACPYILDDLVSFVILWGLINAWFGNWIPVGSALVLGGLLGYGAIRESRGRA